MGHGATLREHQGINVKAGSTSRATTSSIPICERHFYLGTHYINLMIFPSSLSRPPSLLLRCESSIKRVWFCVAGSTYHPHVYTIKQRHQVLPVCDDVIHINQNIFHYIIVFFVFVFVLVLAPLTVHFVV